MISLETAGAGATVWASNVSGAANVAAIPTPAANMVTPDLAVKRRPIVL